MTASRMRTHAHTRPVEGPRVEEREEYGPEYPNVRYPLKERLRRASTPAYCTRSGSHEHPFFPAYQDFLLALARDRVEEEITANDFVRGAWRELRRKAG